MNKKLQQKLYDTYPKIFRQKDLSMQETAICWGIACGDGWYTILDLLCAMIQNHINNTKCPQLEATTVKEKFGGLRFYASGGDITTHSYIHFAECMSGMTCESCGNKALTEEVHKWYVTLCDSCLKKHKDDLKKRDTKFKAIIAKEKIAAKKRGFVK